MSHGGQRKTAATRRVQTKTLCRRVLETQLPLATSLGWSLTRRMTAFPGHRKGATVFVFMVVACTSCRLTGSGAMSSGQAAVTHHHHQQATMIRMADVAAGGPKHPNTAAGADETCLLSAGMWDGDPRVGNPRAAKLWDPDGQWSWSPFSNCSFDSDLLSEAILSAAPTRAGGTRPPPAWFPGGKLDILLLGDSLDQQLVLALCQVGRRFGFRASGAALDTPGKKLGRGAVVGSCSNGVFRLTAYRLFGIHPTTVAMPDVAVKDDERGLKDESVLLASRRLAELLPGDVDDFESVQAMVLGSCLWDLSRPVTTTDPMPRQAVLTYEHEVHRLVRLLRARYPLKQLYLRTTPPLNEQRLSSSGKQRSPAYIGRTRSKRGRWNAGSVGKAVTPAFSGRTQRNQNMLNQALAYAASQEYRAGFLDATALRWDWMMTGYNDFAADGRHYPPTPSLAFLNLLLNALRGRLLGA